MELASVRIFVADLPAAVKFYSQVVGLQQIVDEPDVAIFGESPGGRPRSARQARR